MSSLAAFTCGITFDMGGADGGTPLDLASMEGLGRTFGNAPDAPQGPL